jgi:hypothetical protein
VSQGRNRRSTERFKANNLVTYSAVRADRLYKLLGLAVTLDLSETGLRVRTQEALPLGEELRFHLKLGQQIYDVVGRIVWGSEVEQDKVYEFGVRFKSMDFGLAKDLWSITESALAVGSSKSPERATVDRIVASLAQSLGDDAVTTLSEEERAVLRRVLTSTAERSAAGSDRLPAMPAVVAPESRAEQRSLLQGITLPSTDSGKVVITIPTPTPPGGTRAYRERAPTPKPQGMVGNFEGDQLIEFVQMLGMQAKTGVLEVSAEDGGGHLAFREGKVIAARSEGQKRGDEAAYHILSLPRGHFDFWPHSLSAVTTEHSFSVQTLLLEVLRRRDETTDGA